MNACFVFLVPALAAMAQSPRSTLLSNGLRVAVTEDFGRPLVRARLRFDLPAVGNAMTTFALEIMDHSATGSHSRGSFNRALDHAGLTLGRTFEAHSVTWELVGPPQGLDAGLALLADQVLRPQIDGTVVERARLRLFRDLQGQSPAQRGLKRVRARFAAAEGPPPDEAILSQTGESEIDPFLRELLRPRNASLAIEGAVSESQARTAAFLHFGTWPEGPAPVPRAPADAPSRLTLVPGGAPQAWLGVDLSGTPAAFRKILFLAAPRTSTSGADVELHSEGFALQRPGGNPLESLHALRADLDEFAKKGLNPADFEAAKRRHASVVATLGLHPSAAGLRGTAAAALSAEITAMDLATFNGILQKAFLTQHSTALLVGLTAKDSADPRLEAFGEPEVWFEAKGAFIRRAKAKPN